jgi:hypothetical protein
MLRKAFAITSRSSMYRTGWIFSAALSRIVVFEPHRVHFGIDDSLIFNLYKALIESFPPIAAVQIL